MIDIRGLEKWKVLKALHKGANPPRNNEGWDLTKLVGTDEQYQEFIKELGDPEIDYVGGSELEVERLQGRKLDVKIAGDRLDPKPYNVHNGGGAAEAAIAQLRAAEANSD